MSTEMTLTLLVECTTCGSVLHVSAKKKQPPDPATLVLEVEPCPECLRTAQEE